jgi:hypothetical protein
MYRIELAPGEVTVFRTIEELATGVRNGVITSRARIYHGASEKWLPIEFHPHYKRVIETPAGQPVEIPPPAPSERPPRGERTVVKDVLPAQAPAVAAMAHAPAAKPIFFEQEPEPAEPENEGEPISDGESADAADGVLLPVTTSPVLQLPKITYPLITPAEEPVSNRSGQGERTRRPLHLAGLALALALGGYLVVSAFSPARRDAAPAAATVPRPAMPQPAMPQPAARPEPARLPPKLPRTSSVPARPAPLPPASSGFAAALDPRANVSAPALVAPRSAGAQSVDSALVTAPAAIDVDLTAPALPESDSLDTQSRHRDSATLKRILQAVSGTEAAPRP